MSVALTVNGQSFDYPEKGDQNWGPDGTEWAIAITNGMLQKAGGLFQLLNEVDFGSSHGIKSLYYKSRSANIADSGVLRLANGNNISWRNNADSGNLVLSTNASDQLTYQGIPLVSGAYIASVNDTSTINLTLTGTALSADIVSGSITNTQISNSAAIALSKLATVTADRVLVSDGSGFVSASSVDTTTLGYLDATSSIQTQLNAKLSLSGGTMSGAINMGSQLINNLSDPVSAQDAATKNYVDTVAQGLNAKPAVDVATTTNITLSGEQTIDGVLTSGSRVLVKNQSLAEENGIYVSAAGAWSRVDDADTWDKLVSAFVFVSQGSTQADTGWVCTVDAGGTLGTTPVSFVQFSSAGIILAGNGLTKTGNTLDVSVDNSTIEINSNNLRVKPLGITDGEISASAAIARSKLAALTASRVMVTDGSGYDTVSTTTATELGYVSGVTSAIQTQLDGKLPTTITTTGDIIYSSSGTTAQRLGIGSTGQVLTVAGGVPTWAAPTAPNPIVTSVTGTLNLTSGDSNKIFLIDTTAARTINLPAPASGLIFRFKDITGQANTNNITLVRNASEQIEGVAASKTLQTNWGSWTLVSDGTNWFLI